MHQSNMNKHFMGLDQNHAYVQHILLRNDVPEGLLFAFVGSDL